jgi:hypothetical protein
MLTTLINIMLDLGAVVAGLGVSIFCVMGFVVWMCGSDLKTPRQLK